MSNLSVLVIEDNPLARKVMASQLAGYHVDFAETLTVAKEKFETGRYDLCFIDLKLGDKDSYSGLELIGLARARGIYSVVMSGYDSDPMIEKAYELGTDDFYAKGNEETNVSNVLSRFLERRDKSKEDGLFKDRFVTQDEATQIAISEGLKYAPSDLPILILGPSGTGKTSLARLLHDYSKRQGEFVAINCAAHTEELLEAELFGYRKGAFTGANDNRKGKLLMADGGTLFLDEIGTISLKMQTKLLKAIEEKSFYPLGSDKPETSNFRIISATLEDIQSLIKDGRLRFDFFQRIHGLTIKLKPLCERTGDILSLISLFTKGGKRLGFAPEAKEALLGYSWPGNIRELKKFVDLMVAGEEGRMTAETVKKLIGAMRVEGAGPDFTTEEQYRFALREGTDEALTRFTDALIARHLKANGGRRLETMRALKISLRIFYQSLKRQGMPIRERSIKPKRVPTDNASRPSAEAPPQRVGTYRVPLPGVQGPLERPRRVGPEGREVAPTTQSFGGRWPAGGGTPAAV